MKKKISVTIDCERMDEIDRVLESGRFRNRSHLVECGIRKILEGEWEK